MHREGMRPAAKPLLLQSRAQVQRKLHACVGHICVYMRAELPLLTVGLQCRPLVVWLWGLTHQLALRPLSTAQFRT